MLTAGQLAHALAFARHGHAVLPLTWPIRGVNGRLVCSCRKAADCVSPAKHPYARLAPNGLLSASTDLAVIRKWFADEPQAGVVTGKLVVLDIDPRHAGDGSLAALERDHDFPPTWRAMTGGGGEHVIFRCPEGVTVNSSQAQNNPLLGPGIDIRARDGYIVAPPSRHLSGRAYAWSVDHHPADIPLAEAPAWLVERLAARPEAPKPATPAGVWRVLTGEITEYADAAAARAAGHLLRRGVDTGLAAGLLFAWNAQCCRPPLPAVELHRIFDRVCHREAERLERKDGAA